MHRTWSDAEWDWLLERLSQEDATELLAQMSVRIQGDDVAAGQPVKEGQSPTQGPRPGVLKEVAALLEPGYRARFQQPLIGESEQEFKKRKAARKKAGLDTMRAESETREACEARLNESNLRRRLLNFVKHYSPNKRKRVRIARLPGMGSPEKSARRHTPYSVFKASPQVAAEAAATTSTSNGVTKFRIGDWTAKVKETYDALGPEAMMHLEGEAKRLNEASAPLSEGLLRLATDAKIAQLPKSIMGLQDSWLKETGWCTVIFAGGPGVRGASQSVTTHLSENIRNPEGLSLVEYLCKRFDIPSDRFALEVNAFFNEALQPLNQKRSSIDTGARDVSDAESIAVDSGVDVGHAVGQSVAVEGEFGGGEGPLGAVSEVVAGESVVMDSVAGTSAVDVVDAVGQSVAMEGEFGEGDGPVGGVSEVVVGDSTRDAFIPNAPANLGVSETHDSPLPVAAGVEGESDTLTPGSGADVRDGLDGAVGSSRAGDSVQNEVQVPTEVAAAVEHARESTTVEGLRAGGAGTGRQGLGTGGLYDRRLQAPGRSSGLETGCADWAEIGKTVEGAEASTAREVTVLLADFIMKASYRDDDDPADGDLPVKQMSKEFKTHVDLTVRCAAASERFRLTGHKCDECGKRGGSLAIAKKLGAIGTVFYNCVSCPSYQFIGAVFLSVAERDEIEAMRVLEVAKWLEKCKNKAAKCKQVKGEPEAPMSGDSRSSGDSSRKGKRVLVPSTPPSRQLGGRTRVRTKREGKQAMGKKSESSPSSASVASASAGRSSNGGSNVLVPSTPPSSQLGTAATGTAKRGDNSKTSNGEKLPSLMSRFFMKEYKTFMDDSSDSEVEVVDYKAVKKIKKEEIDGEVDFKVKEESSDGEVEFVDDEAERMALKKRVEARKALQAKMAGKGSKEQPITLDFCDDAEEGLRSMESDAVVEALTSSQTSTRDGTGAQGQERKRKLTKVEVEEAFAVKKRKTNLTGDSVTQESARDIIVVTWHKAGAEATIVTERVSGTFAVDNFTETCRTLDIDPLGGGKFCVWFPKRADWVTFGVREKIEGYADEYGAVLIRSEGVDVSEGFLAGAKKLLGE
ncbi:hypothetical protein BDW22DRAFT_1426919 [Trametopsis cervina]|nr:hypothetical protein BDW22DRAFT_1426919 [Trametopsis cervina]